MSLPASGELGRTGMNPSRFELLLYSDPVSIALLATLILISVAAAVMAVVVGSSLLRDGWRQRFRTAAGRAWRSYRIESR